jgi:nucleotide-binding universal stress UspA family protein
MISSVLVPLDGSPEAEQAIPYAQALLPPDGAGLLFRVVPEVEPLLTELVWTLDATGETAEVAVVREDLERVKARLGADRVRWRVDVACGDPAEQVLRVIEEKGIGLVAMTTHGRGAIGRATFGSVADRIARTSPVPVLLVRPQPAEAIPETADIRRLLVPLDGSELAEAALPLVEELARRLAIPVRLVRAINYAATLAALTDGGVLPMTPSPELYDRMVDDLEGTARDCLGSVATRLEGQGIRVSWAVLGGSPFFDIAEAAEPRDLLVMTSHGRGGALR